MTSTQEHDAHPLQLRSVHAFDATLQRLSDAIEARGLTLFSRIDHAALAAAAGLSMPPTTVMLYGNPKAGTPVMLAVPAAALDLPLRLLVREDAGGGTWVAWHPVASMLQAIGVEAQAADRLAPAQAWIASVIGA